MAAFRAVLDTNVVLAAHRTENPSSPNLEILDPMGPTGVRAVVFG